ncbi:MAG TPA: ABC transporter permease subunit [Miltoncostaeaceae bacterium]|nr:ABC transporter permease subunit [Miltoncostaeaceae bacterium]
MTATASPPQPRPWAGALAVARHTLQESLRRRVLLVVALLTALFGAGYWFVATQAFEETESAGGIRDIDEHALVGGTLVGLAMFGTMFLGTVLGAFLTLGAVRGDAERGVLQPIVVRPMGRASVLLARFAAAATVCIGYVIVVLLGAMCLIRVVGGYWPDRIAQPVLQLAAAVVVIVALSVLGSTVLSTNANGIAVFMVFGGGLVAGLIGQIGEAVNSPTMQDVAFWGSHLLPFQALYQGGLDALTADTRGLTGVIVRLGPFGGAEASGPGLWAWAALFTVGVLAAAVALFARRDL